ncbi:MAG TPA: sigma-54 dependent transcriptional regulator, partial [Pyrinomonadaceae bacterium]|nr:sigma-54 dependent transcriptional regulator [Pyrinomonadaceae bacterium]
AFEYLQKPYDSEKLLETVSRALKKLSTLDAEIVSVSPEMDKVKKLILKIAKSNSTVLIRGESGTGKELIARSMHTNSLRSSEVFQAVNCAAINENLLESELFGHEKGSFTGAVAEKKGLFEIAHNGTLFLDEIGELDIALQAKILRALQEKQIRRVGGIRDIDVDVRVVAATNRDLLHMVEEKRFREDLYYRLNVLSIELPALRERRTDIPVLIEYFLKKHTRGTSRKVSFSAEARRSLDNYSYPGNVRQLESAIERAILLCENDTITNDDLPPEMFSDRGGHRSTSASGEPFVLPAEGVNWEDVERSLIMQAMERTDNNITKSAKLLGLTFRTLQYRLEKFGAKKDEDAGTGDDENS